MNSISNFFPNNSTFALYIFEVISPAAVDIFSSLLEESLVGFIKSCLIRHKEAAVSIKAYKDFFSELDIMVIGIIG